MRKWHEMDYEEAKSWERDEITRGCIDGFRGTEDGQASGGRLHCGLDKQAAMTQLPPMVVS